MGGRVGWEGGWVDGWRQDTGGWVGEKREYVPSFRADTPQLSPRGVRTKASNDLETYVPVDVHRLGGLVGGWGRGERGGLGKSGLVSAGG